MYAGEPLWSFSRSFSPIRCFPKQKLVRMMSFDRVFRTMLPSCIKEKKQLKKQSRMGYEENHNLEISVYDVPVVQILHDLHNIVEDLK